MNKSTTKARRLINFGHRLPRCLILAVAILFAIVLATVPSPSIRSATSRHVNQSASHNMAANVMDQIAPAAKCQETLPSTNPGDCETVRSECWRIYQMLYQLCYDATPPGQTKLDCIIRMAGFYTDCVRSNGC